MRRSLILVGLAVAALFAFRAFHYLPAAQLPPQSITVCFSPEGQCAAAAIRAIDAATTSIRMHAYSFTSGSGFAQALARATRRGVDVQVVADTTTPCGNGSAVQILVDAAIPVFIDSAPPIAHEKALIIDSHLVISGSYNWTVQAAHNSEAMNFIDNPDVAAAYLGHWNVRQAASKPLAADYSCNKEKRVAE